MSASLKHCAARCPHERAIYDTYLSEVVPKRSGNTVRLVIYHVTLSAVENCQSSCAIIGPKRRQGTF